MDVDQFIKATRLPVRRYRENDLIVDGIAAVLVRRADGRVAAGSTPGEALGAGGALLTSAMPFWDSDGESPRVTFELTTYSKLAPRYFSVMDASADDAWCYSAARAAMGVAFSTAAVPERGTAGVCAGPRLLFLARGGTDLLTYSTYLFSGLEAIENHTTVWAGHRMARRSRLEMWPTPVVEAHDVSHNLAAIAVPSLINGRNASGASRTGGIRLVAVGGQHLDNPPPKKSKRVERIVRSWHRSDGVYLLQAAKLVDVLSARWFPRWRAPDKKSRRRPRLFYDTHASRSCADPV